MPNTDGFRSQIIVVQHDSNKDLVTNLPMANVRAGTAGTLDPSKHGRRLLLLSVVMGLASGQDCTIWSSEELAPATLDSKRYANARRSTHRRVAGFKPFKDDRVTLRPASLGSDETVMDGRQRRTVVAEIPSPLRSRRYRPVYAAPRCAVATRLTRSLRILYSNDVRFMPRRSAAPFRPPTTQFVASRARRI
jgi:hypothetical protein